VAVPKVDAFGVDPSEVRTYGTRTSMKRWTGLSRVKGLQVKQTTGLCDTIT
jgi:hypothetical protein